MSSLDLIPMFLVEPYHPRFPNIGIYLVVQDDDGYGIYLDGSYYHHHPSRFIEPSSLLLELF